MLRPREVPVITSFKCLFWCWQTENFLIGTDNFDLRPTFSVIQQENFCIIKIFPLATLQNIIFYNTIMDNTQLSMNFWRNYRKRKQMYTQWKKSFIYRNILKIPSWIRKTHGNLSCRGFDLAKQRIFSNLT